MADRRHSMNRDTTGTARGTGRAASAAWVLAVLAGTPLAAAQFDLKGSGAKAPDPQTIAQAQTDGSQLRDPMAGKNLGKDGEVKVSDQLIVELHVKDEDLANVLQMLSIQSQINIIASKNVSATVTADLYGATFFEALDAILHVNGYGYVQKGNFIYVYTADELQAIQDANRKMIHKAIHLDYLNATDAAEFAKPLLSEKGEITTTGATPDFSIPDNAPIGKDSYALGAVMVVNDYEENLEAIEALVKEIDTRPAQVLVEATVLQTSLSEANAFGVDFTVLGSLDMADFTGIGGPLEAVKGLINGAGATVDGTKVQVPATGENGGAVTQTVGNTSGPGGLKVGVVAGDVAAFLKVLDEVTDTTVISRPNILTLNRQPARVLVGTKVGYLSSTSTDTSTTQTVQFLDTGTQLYFRPFVSRDGMIRMELKPQVSTATIRDVTDSGGSSVTIPDEKTNELSTNVLVRDGNTIVLGGLFTENTKASRRQVPWLGDLPVVGIPFQGRDDTTDRAEIIFMIKPTIVNDQLMLEQGQRGNEYVNHVRAGAREGLLIWSRERQTSRLLVEADRKEKAGDTEGALYSVERSLRLNPFQPEAIAMRERLSTKKRVHPSRSMLDIILNNESGMNPAMAPGGNGADAGTNFALGQEESTPADAWETSPYNSDLEPSDIQNASTPDAEPVTDDSQGVASGPQSRVDDSAAERERAEQARQAQIAQVKADQARAAQAQADQELADQAQAEQARANEALAKSRAELARVNQQIAASRAELSATQNRAVQAQSDSTTAPLGIESTGAESETTGASQNQGAPWLSTNSDNAPADESAYFDGGAFSRIDPPVVDGSVGQFSSDEVDVLIDQIAADAFWQRSTSEKYLNGLSSGERGAPIAG